MQKKILKVTAALVLASFVSGSAFASTMYHGAPKKSSANVKGTFGTVAIHNTTNSYVYIVNSHFLPSYQSTGPVTLYPVSTGDPSWVTFEVNAPDTAACLQIANFPSGSGYLSTACFRNAKIDVLTDQFGQPYLYVN